MTPYLMRPIGNKLTISVAMRREAGMSLYLFLAWLWTSFLLTAASSNILPSLSDLDFARIRGDHHAHSHARDTAPRVSVERWLEGAGYHRELVTTVTVTEVVGGYRDDRVLLVENVTRNMYLDLDQVGNLGLGNVGPELDG